MCPSPAAPAAPARWLLLPALVLWLAAGGAGGAERAAPPLAPRPRCPPPPARCHEKPFARNEYFFTVEGVELMVQFLDGKHFELTCPDNVTLDSGALPRLRGRGGAAGGADVDVDVAILRGCPAPRAGYAAALRALGVRPRAALRLLEAPRDAVSAAALAALPPALRALELELADAAAGALLPDDFAAELVVAELRVAGAALSPGALLRLPPTLRVLALGDAGLRELPAPVLERLPALERLELRDPALHAPPALAAARALTAVMLDAPLPALPPLARLREVLAWHLAPSARLAALPGAECAALRRLLFGWWEGAALPPGWLAACAGLEEVELTALALHSLPALLPAGPALRNFTVTHCSSLVTLAPDALDGARGLRRLDLSYNALEYLPSGVFASLVELEWLDLSGNRLDAGAGAALQPLGAVRALLLDGNPLGDLCGRADATVFATGVSPLAHLASLTRLGLAGTGAVRVCVDWRKAMPNLLDLDLSDNDITSLEFDDLEFERSNRSQVDLRGNPVQALEYSRAQYEAVVAGARAARGAEVAVLVDAALRCDCRVYWAARALQERPQHAALPGLRCAGGELLARADPARLRCALPAELCAPRCACWVSPAALWADCSAAGLTRVPRLPPPVPHAPRAPHASLAPPVRLLLADNHISNLTVEDLPDSIAELDLRNNSLSHVDPETATALFATQRVLWLAGNPLRCACADRALLHALQAHPEAVRDFGRLNCSDGRAVRRLRVAELCGVAGGARPVVWAAGAVAVVVSLAVGALLASRHRRRLVGGLKTALLARGLCVGWALRPADADDEDEDEGEERPYDAFVSFAHGDEGWVAGQLVPRLERAGYALCVHYRDFTPGELIGVQIDAAVRRARRTLAVLSPRYAASPWARAEFRAALALGVREGRPRLLALLPPPGEPLGELDDAARAHLTAHTYLRRDDPWFWERLRAALGRPRGRRTPAAAPAPRPGALVASRGGPTGVSWPPPAALSSKSFELPAVPPSSLSLELPGVPSGKIELSPRPGDDVSESSRLPLSAAALLAR